MVEAFPFETNASGLAGLRIILMDCRADATRGRFPGPCANHPRRAWNRQSPAIRQARASPRRLPLGNRLASDLQGGFQKRVRGRRRDGDLPGGGARHLVHGDVRRDSDFAVGLSRRRIETGGSQTHAGAARLEGENALHGPFPIAPLSDDRSPPMVADRAGEDLRRAGAVAVDQNNQGNRPGPRRVCRVPGLPRLRPRVVTIVPLSTDLSTPRRPSPAIAGIPRRSITRLRMPQWVPGGIDIPGGGFWKQVSLRYRFHKPGR